MEIFLLAYALMNVWPFLLLGAVFMATLAWLGTGRVLATIAAAVLCLGALLGGMVTLRGHKLDMEMQARARGDMEVQAQAREDAAWLRMKLQTETEIDGITLPAGTEVTWTDAKRTRLRNATMPEPTAILGLSTRSFSREEDGFRIEMDREQDVGGWPCNKGIVKIGRNGALRSCELSSKLEWGGWTLPERTLIVPHLLNSGIDFTLDSGAGSLILAREIGRQLPTSSSVSLNEDGSLESVKFDWDEPFVVHDIVFQNRVKWSYDAVTLGQGRARPPVAVEGTARLVPGGSGTRDMYEQITLQLSDGVITRR